MGGEQFRGNASKLFFWVNTKNIKIELGRIHFKILFVKLLYPQTSFTRNQQTVPLTKTRPSSMTSPRSATGRKQTSPR